MNGEVAKQAPLKNKDSGQYIAAVLLCFFLGGWSAHNIFLKKWKCVIPQLICKFVTLAFFIFAIVSISTLGHEVGDGGWWFPNWPWFLWIGTFLAYHIWIFVEFIILCCGKYKDNNENYVCYQ